MRWPDFDLFGLFERKQSKCGGGGGGGGGEGNKNIEEGK